MRYKKNNTKYSLKKSINQHQTVFENLHKNEKTIVGCIKLIVQQLRKKGKILICGNGGSAADAQHLVAELLVRLKPNSNRAPLPAISLAMDTSTITACSNDLGYDNLFSRNFKALHNKNDILIVISTSGNSKNIINVLKEAKKNKIITIGFLGSGGGKAKKFCRKSIIVKSNNVARIQEAHIFLGHYIIEQVENNFFN